MKKLSIGTQTFAKIIEDDCIYVDKTKYIYDLIQGYGYFLARPRRFGKSLLCSTLKDLFLGKKELFNDLWIDKNTDYKWPVHPVIHIDLSQVSSNDPQEITTILMRNLDDMAELYDLEKLEHTTPGEMLKKLTMRLYKKFGSSNRVVIIIDEYDKPILDNVDKKEVAYEIRRILRTFYEFIKSLDEYLRFVFITGITRISKTSIFSGMNQLPNISMDSQYAHIIGYTKSEIDLYFDEYFCNIAQNKKLSVQTGIDELKSELHAWYNGYRFWKDEQPLTRDLSGDGLERLYSPFSVLNFLRNKGDFSNYWFESGTPSFLIKILEQNNYPIEVFDTLKADMNELMAFDILNIPLPTLLFQAGYATIREYDVDSKLYSLDMPNYEVKESLLKCILSSITQYKSSFITSELVELRKTLEDGNLNDFINKIKNFFATVPYTIAIDKEKYYQTIFFIILKLINLKPDVEIATNIGRIDMTVNTNNKIYIFEFKLDVSAEKALKQIEDKKYYERYINSSKKITFVGVNFSSTDKNINEFLAKDFR